MRSPRSSSRRGVRSSAPTRCCKKASTNLLKVPGVEEAVMFAGFDGASGTQAPNAGAAYVTFKPFEERAGTDRHRARIIENDMRAALADMDEAFVFVVPPPVIQGIGNGGGYRMIVQDRSDERLSGARAGGGQADRRRHNQDPALANVFTSTTPRPRASLPTSTAPRPTCSACRRSACSRRCRSISARPTSTTSTCSAAPTA